MRPRRSWTLRIPAVALAVVAVACGSSEVGEPLAAAGSAPDRDVPVTTIATEREPDLPVTVPSADGREVTVTDVSRIVPLQGNLAEVVFALGLGDRVVGRDISTTFDEAADLPVVTRAHDVSAESVLSLHPTVVLADTNSGPPEALDHLRNVGVPVVVFDVPLGLGDVDDRIVAVARALGVEPAGTSVAARARAEIEQVQADVPAIGEPPVVAFLYLRGQAGVALLGGRGSGADSMIAAAGGVDAGTALGLGDAFTPLTSEALVEAAPDVLLLTTTGLESVGGVDGLLEMPGIAQTPAGRARRVATIEDGLLFSFGTRTPEALRHLADQLHAR